MGNLVQNERSQYIAGLLKQGMSPGDVAHTTAQHFGTSTANWNQSSLTPAYVSGGYQPYSAPASNMSNMSYTSSQRAASTLLPVGIGQEEANLIRQMGSGIPTASVGGVTANIPTATPRSVISVPVSSVRQMGANISQPAPNVKLNASISRPIGINTRPVSVGANINRLIQHTPSFSWLGTGDHGTMIGGNPRRLFRNMARASAVSSASLR
jgi:hypothetical protein